MRLLVLLTVLSFVGCVYSSSSSEEDLTEIDALFLGPRRPLARDRRRTRRKVTALLKSVLQTVRESHRELRREIALFRKQVVATSWGASRRATCVNRQNGCDDALQLVSVCLFSSFFFFLPFFFFPPFAHPKSKVVNTIVADPNVGSTKHRLLALLRLWKWARRRVNHRLKKNRRAQFTVDPIAQSSRIARAMHTVWSEICPANVCREKSMEKFGRLIQALRDAAAIEDDVMPRFWDLIRKRYASLDAGDLRLSIAQARVLREILDASASLYGPWKRVGEGCLEADDDGKCAGLLQEMAKTFTLRVQAQNRRAFIVNHYYNQRVLPVHIPLLVVTCLTVLILCGIFVTASILRIIQYFSKWILAMMVLVLFVAALSMPRLLSFLWGGQIVLLSTSDFVIDRLAHTATLAAGLVFFWLWSGVVVNMLGASSTQTWLAFRVTALMALGAAALGGIVCSILEGIVRSTGAPIDGEFRIAYLVEAAVFFALSLVLLCLAVFAYWRARSSADPVVLRAFRWTLASIALLPCACALILASVILGEFTSLSRAGWITAAIGLMLFYVAMIVAIGSHFISVLKDNKRKAESSSDASRQEQQQQPLLAHYDM